MKECQIKIDDSCWTILLTQNSERCLPKFQRWNKIQEIKKNAEMLCDINSCVRKWVLDILPYIKLRNVQPDRRGRNVREIRKQIKQNVEYVQSINMKGRFGELLFSLPGNLIVLFINARRKQRNKKKQKKTNVQRTVRNKSA